MKISKQEKKVILAFSGGLDTSFCALYLKEQGYDVVTMTLDSGGFNSQEIKQISKQSKLVGATKHYLLDVKNEFFEKIISNIIKGNILRGGVYPLCTGSERLLIALKAVEIAKKEEAQIIAHGCTGAGNDQVRIDVSIQTLNPQLKIIAPYRDLGMTREKEYQILKKHNIIFQNYKKLYSTNQNLLGITIGGKETNGSWESLPEEEYFGVNPLAKTPDHAKEIVISFYKGLPIAIDNQQMSGVKIMDYLRKVGGEYGVGKGIHLGTTILGIKGRLGFVAPAISILIKAHKELEKLVLTKWQIFWKDVLAEAYGNFFHEALYFDPVMEDIKAMIDSSQKRVNGEVKIKLYKGNIIIEGCKSPYSLMNPQIATYAEGNSFWTGKEAVGFCKIYGLQSILAYKAYKLGKKYEKSKVH